MTMQSPIHKNLTLNTLAMDISHGPIVLELTLITALREGGGVPLPYSRLPNLYQTSASS